MRYDQDIGKQDRGIETEAADRLRRQLKKCRPVASCALDEHTEISGTFAPARRHLRMDNVSQP